MASTDTYEALAQPKGQAYRDEQVTSYSHYNDAIDQTPGRAAGNSRVWGDIGPAAQSRVIDELIAAGERADLKPREIAYVLATARVESGFNLDAAAGTTSAVGLGQFIGRTGAAYGINDANRSDLNKQAEALVAHFKDNARLAQSRGQGEAYVYKYHHDGPVSDYGGLDIAKKQVLPYLDTYEKFVNEHQKKYGVETTDPKLAAGQAATSRSQALNQGAHGPVVSELQTKLGQLGYTGTDGKPINADGSFGRGTRETVKAFQRDNHLKEDGAVGPGTLQAIDAKLKERVGPSLSQGLIADASHAGHAMFQQAKSALQKIDAQYGRKPDQLTDNGAAAVAVAAQRAGMTRIDHLELGGLDNSKIIAVQGTPGTPFSKVITVPTVEAMHTPVAQSSQAFTLAQQAQQPQQMAPPAPQQAAPAMSR
jgi:peptidoglycan hydrolase-like protein with peptidoglycan-binding domain